MAALSLIIFLLFEIHMFPSLWFGHPFSIFFDIRYKSYGVVFALPIDESNFNGG